MNAVDVVLDTSAIFALLRDEPGADRVETHLEKASVEEKVAVSFVSITEIFYNTLQLAERRRADEMVAMVKSWAVDIIYADEALCLLAGELKAAFRLSFADAFVAATAEQADALLLHKDPEFESLRGRIRLEALPFKARR